MLILIFFFLGKEYVIEFDFLGKDSIRYHNFVPIEKRVFKNLQLFVENKKEGDDLFDRLNTSILNEYLSSLMPGLTAKVFRTYNASITLQEQLNKLTDADDNIPAKVNYNANLTVHGEEGWGVGAIISSRDLNKDFWVSHGFRPFWGLCLHPP